MRSKIIKIFIACISLSIFFYIVYLYSHNKLEAFDMAIYNSIIKFKSPLITFILKIITTFANPLNLFIIVIMLLILIKNKQVGILVIINLILNSLLNLALKNIFTRGRPTITHLIKENGYSLPSGHAMASLAFYGLIIYLVYKSVNLSKKVKTILISLLTLLIILIGISRIYLGVHYVSDVIAGYSITTFYLIIYTEIIKNNLRGRSNEKKQVSK